MKIFKRISIVLLVLVVLMGGLFAGGYFYVKINFGIDLIQALGQINALKTPVDESVLCSNAFSTEDMASTQTQVNNSISGLITNDDNEYQVDVEGVYSLMSGDISLTDKQLGALMDTLLRQQSNGKVQINGVEIDAEIKQVSFLQVSNGDVLMNCVLMVNVQPMIDQMAVKFPLSLVKGLLPSVIYINSTFIIEKNAGAFNYTVYAQELTINNMDEQQTSELFETINKIVSFGTVDDWNVQIGIVFADAFIGNYEEQGFAYSLYYLGARDFSFTQIGGEITFNILD